MSGGSVRCDNRIVELKAFTVAKTEVKTAQQGADCHDVADGHWIDGSPMPIANPMSRYVHYKASRRSWGINALGTVVVTATDSAGNVGVGVSIGGAPACHVIEDHYARFVEGQRVADIEAMWDMMWRSSINYGRKGLSVQALSAVDLALWDLLGKAVDLPVFALLGGRSVDPLPVYITGVRPDLAKSMGFVGAKVPCPYGPADGESGFEKNVAQFGEWRDSVGGSFPLALDCYMSLTTPYATRLGRVLSERHGLKWIEEVVHPDDYAGLAAVKRALTGHTMVTAGEHEYSRWGFRQMLCGAEAGGTPSVDILQPDVTWCGGITEARRVVALASAFDVPVIPHGSSVYSYHMQTAFPSCPAAEFISLHPTCEALVPYFGGLFPDEPLPTGGTISLDSSRAGFGVTLNPALPLVRVAARGPEASARNVAANVARGGVKTPHVLAL